MPEVVIRVVRTDVNGHIRVRPARPSKWSDYAFIYRDGSCVRWDDATSELFIDPLQTFSSVDEFLRIRNAVKSEYGDTLVFDSSTSFEDVPVAVISQIKNAPAT